LATLNFINIKDINRFISEVKKLHIHRQFSNESSDRDLAYNKKVFSKEIEPTQDFYHLLKLVENSNRQADFTKNRSKVMNLIIKLLPETGKYVIRGAPLTFTSFSRTITWYLSDKMDLFVQILTLQLLAVNYFKSSPSLKDRNILSICGRHAYNPFYFKQVLSDINEEVLTDLNSEHDRLSMTRDYL
jgi:hypothetical protein